MTAVPVTRTFVAGEVVLASYFNTNINGPINFLLAPPIVRLRQTTLQTVTTSTLTAVTYTTEDVDSSGMHSTSTNTSRCTSVYPGWYRQSGGFCFVSNATGVRLADIGVNGTGLNGSRLTYPTISGLVVSCATRTMKAFLNVGDYLEQFIFQSSGGNLNTNAGASTETCSLDMEWVSN